MNRKKFILIYLSILFCLSLTIFFGLKIYSHKKFNDSALNQLIVGKSKFRDITDKLCKFQILGEPKVDKNYVKINFWCNDGSKARSTFALVAFDDQTTNGILREYSRIIGFDFSIIKDKGWICSLNNQEINPNLADKIVPQASTIDCFESKGVTKHD